jgi:hypothetical protein
LNDTALDAHCNRRLSGTTRPVAHAGEERSVPPGRSGSAAGRGSGVNDRAKTKSGPAGAAAPGAAAAAPVEFAKQAVIIVHGMGEQRPMDTLKSFVSTVWEQDRKTSDPDARPEPNKVWSKPDSRSGSLELRRITTRESRKSRAYPVGVRTDFYELYWADLTAGSTWQQFLAWMKYLLFRRPSHVPKNLKPAWRALWLLTLLCTALALLTILPESLWTATFLRFVPRWLFLALVSAGGATLTYYATRYFGRVVRYTRADPDNIAARAAVRERGLKLLRDLHDGSYARIVLASHSLGTILAYDLLSYFWAERAKARTMAEGTRAFAAACKVEGAAAALDALAESEARRAAQGLAVADPAARPAALLAWRKAQAVLRRELNARYGEARWLISDFVTFGSPLTHAEVLLASGKEDLENRISARELPRCPPRREDLDPETVARAVATREIPLADPPASSHLMIYPDAHGAPIWTLHHAAPFAAVRWTNFHDPARWIWRGDVIGGPLACHFGPGIVDIDLSACRGPSRGFTHTRYWDDKAPRKQLAAVRHAINLLDETHDILACSEARAAPPGPGRLPAAADDPA